MNKVLEQHLDQLVAGQKASLRSYLHTHKSKVSTPKSKPKPYPGHGNTQKVSQNDPIFDMVDKHMKEAAAKADVFKGSDFDFSKNFCAEVKMENNTVKVASPNGSSYGLNSNGNWEQLPKDRYQRVDYSKYNDFTTKKIEEGQTNQAQNNNLMSNLMNVPGLNMDFGKLTTGRIALSLNGELAFADNKGGWVIISEGENGKERVDVGSLKFDVDFFKVPTKELNVGDIVLLDGEILKVTENSKGDTKFVNPVTGSTTNKLPRNNIFGVYLYTKIVSLFDLGGKSGLGLNGLNPMTLMLLSGDKELSGSSDLSTMLLMSQLGGEGGEIDPMMLMMMSQNGSTTGSSNDMMKFMMLSGLSGKTGGLFGKKTPVKAAAKAAKPTLAEARKIVKAAEARNTKKK